MQPMGLRFSDERLPAAYDRLFTGSFFGPWARILVDLVELRPGDAVLDVATGPEPSRVWPPSASVLSPGWLAST